MAKIIKTLSRCWHYTELSTEKGQEEEFSAYTKDFSIFLPPEAKTNYNQRTHQIRLQIKKLVRKWNYHLLVLRYEKGEKEELSADTKDFSIFLPPEAKKNHKQRAQQIRLQIKKLVRKGN